MRETVKQYRSIVELIRHALTVPPVAPTDDPIERAQLVTHRAEAVRVILDILGTNRDRGSGSTFSHAINLLSLIDDLFPTESDSRGFRS